MATARNDDSNPAPLVPHGSPDLSAVPSGDNIPAITQDEILSSSASPSVIKKEKVKATDAPPKAPKKKKIKKKPTLAPIPAIPTGETKISYDIGNLIIARDDFDFMKSGILPSHAVATPPPSKRVEAKKRRMVNLSGTPIRDNTTFCPDCGLRIDKHGITEWNDNEDDFIVLKCPLDD